MSERVAYARLPASTVPCLLLAARLFILNPPLLRPFLSPPRTPFLPSYSPLLPCESASSDIVYPRPVVRATGFRLIQSQHGCLTLLFVQRQPVNHSFPVRTMLSTPETVATHHGVCPEGCTCAFSVASHIASTPITTLQVAPPSSQVSNTAFMEHLEASSDQVDGYATVHSMLHVLEQRASSLQQERDQAERAYQAAQRSVARYKAAMAEFGKPAPVGSGSEDNGGSGSWSGTTPLALATPPTISRLPIELLIYIFLYVQNTVVAAQVCRYWRQVALSCPRLWSSLHVHPSKGGKHLENLLKRSMGNGNNGSLIDVCFCPVRVGPLKLPADMRHYATYQQDAGGRAAHNAHSSQLHPLVNSYGLPLSLPPIYTQMYHPDMCLTPQIVSILDKHVSRISSFEIHATVPGTWLTLLPFLSHPAPNLRTMHIYTTLPGDVAQLAFFGNNSTYSARPRQSQQDIVSATPKLRNVQITGSFPLRHHSLLLRNLTILRLERVPFIYRPTTSQLSSVLRACPELVSLSLLDAGPVPDEDFDGDDDLATIQEGPIQLNHLRALAFRDTDVVLQPMTPPNHPTTVIHTPNGPILAPVPGGLGLTPTVSQMAGAAGPNVSLGEGGAVWFFENVRMPKLEALQIMLAPHPLACSQTGRMLPVMVHTPATLTANTATSSTTLPVSPLTTALEAQTRSIFQNIQKCETLEELYLWTPHATTGDVYGLLSKFESLKNLELPMVAHPVDTLKLFTVPQVSMDTNGNNRSVFLCPRLERIGIPYIHGCAQPTLEHALMDVFNVRDAISAPDRGVSPLTALLAPGGRPTYISETVWNWIGQRATIQTLLTQQSQAPSPTVQTPSSDPFSLPIRESRMDMLFDRITKEVS